MEICIVGMLLTCPIEQCLQGCFRKYFEIILKHDLLLFFYIANSPSLSYTISKRKYYPQYYQDQYYQLISVFSKFWHRFKPNRTFLVNYISYSSDFHYLPIASHTLHSLKLELHWECWRFENALKSIYHIQEYFAPHRLTYMTKRINYSK